MICGSTGKKLLAKARMILISSVTLPEEKLGAVPNGLSTDSDVAKRFLSLTDEEVLGEGDNAKLEIQIKLDKEKKFLSIRDRGIGMMKEDLIKNLGTIAKSGTSGIYVEQKADGALAISEDTWNEPLGRGTEIRLHIRDEAGEYLEEKNLKRTAQVMYQAALMESGFMLNDPKDFSSRIYSSVKSSLSISPDAIIEDEDDVEEVET
ncbi:hypothetical protein NC653_005192 [Populus alba x Populus x berolinensis]|uniref:Histidine kinase/HSP90-like ATPase domain-containing protein n=1 Tax=Populus alba x Populus x berolinensis TaxID=444605 RepID=A0AAD6RBR0_9ROSI|nr:hypothetical protein NC653_005192 [Populus alba x Populus x berolinensis]